MYLIRKITSCPLFLADRNMTKKFWWTYSLKFAMKYKNEGAAMDKARSLKYGTFRVVTETEARNIRDKADHEHDEKVSQYKKYDPLNLGNYDEGDSEYWNNKDL